MVITWEDLQKNEMIPAQKKTGLPWRHTLGNGASGQSFTRVTIGPLASYAQLDMPGFIHSRRQCRSQRELQREDSTNHPHATAFDPHVALLVQAGLTQDQQTKIAARRNATLGGATETEVYRFIPELSYGTPTAVRSTN
jgi:hypothetical protein